jgi:LPS export ABC transporter protein LptC
MRRFGMITGFPILWLVVTGCNSGKPETSSIQTPVKESPSQEGWNSELIMSYSGRTQAVIRYGHMAQYQSTDRVLFDDGVDVDFYDEGGKHASNLKSLEGEYRPGKEDVLAKGNVVVVSDTGTVLKTESLRWDNQRQRIESDTTVCIITTGLDTLYGLGFESDSELKHWVIRKPWGVSEKRVDIEKFEEGFTEPAKTDTVSSGKVDSSAMGHLKQTVQDSASRNQ